MFKNTSIVLTTSLLIALPAFSSAPRHPDGHDGLLAQHAQGNIAQANVGAPNQYNAQTQPTTDNPTGDDSECDQAKIQKKLEHMIEQLGPKYIGDDIREELSLVPFSDRENVLTCALPFIKRQSESFSIYIRLIIQTIKGIPPGERNVTLEKSLPIFKHFPAYFGSIVKQVDDLTVYDIQDTMGIILLSPESFLLCNGRKYYHNSLFSFHLERCFLLFIKALSKIPIHDRMDVWLRSRPLFESYRFGIMQEFADALIKSVSEVPLQERDDVIEKVEQILKVEPNNNPGIDRPLLIKQMSGEPKSQRQTFVNEFIRDCGFMSSDKSSDTKNNSLPLASMEEDALERTPALKVIGDGEEILTLDKLSQDLIMLILDRMSDQDIVQATSRLSLASRKLNGILTKPGVWDRIMRRLCLPFTVRAVSAEDFAQANFPLFRNLVLASRASASLEEFIAFKNKLVAAPYNKSNFLLGKKKFTLSTSSLSDIDFVDLMLRYHPVIISFEIKGTGSVYSTIKGIEATTNGYAMWGNTLYIAINWEGQ